VHLWCRRACPCDLVSTPQQNSVKAPQKDSNADGKKKNTLNCRNDVVCTDSRLALWLQKRRGQARVSQKCVSSFADTQRAHDAGAFAVSNSSPIPKGLSYVEFFGNAKPSSPEFFSGHPNVCFNKFLVCLFWWRATMAQHLTIGIARFLSFAFLKSSLRWLCWGPFQYSRVLWVIPGLFFCNLFHGLLGTCPPACLLSDTWKGNHRWRTTKTDLGETWGGGSSLGFRV
jgi:hypothetical protein